MTLSTVTVGAEQGIRTSNLGFGCSALVGGRTPSQSQVLLDAAFDAGIRHFDVARVYGTGDAEAAVGRFAARRREEVTIATKFGIVPLPNTAAVAAAKSLIRPLMRRSRSIVRLVRRAAPQTGRRGAFEPDDARVSLRTSLDQLRTSYVDIFLLHDCEAADWSRDELREALDGLVVSGLIRCHGTATTFEETGAILQSGRPPDVAQFDSDAVTLNLSSLGERLGRSTPITYGCLSTALPMLRSALAGDPPLAAEWSRALDVDVSAPDELAALLLCHAVMVNPTGVTLFSAGNPERIRRNVSAVAEGRFEAAQLQEFERRVIALARSTL